MLAESDEVVDVFTVGETIAYCAIFFVLGFFTGCNALMEHLK